MVTTSSAPRFDRSAILRRAWRLYGAAAAWARSLGRPGFNRATFAQCLAESWYLAKREAAVASADPHVRSLAAAEQAVMSAEAAETVGPGRSFDHAGLAAARRDLAAARSALQATA